jgi:hypothetical protein
MSDPLPPMPADLAALERRLEKIEKALEAALARPATSSGVTLEHLKQELAELEQRLEAARAEKRRKRRHPAAAGRPPVDDDDDDAERDPSEDW